MPKPNYAFAKRQKELAKKQKKEEKLKAKALQRQPQDAAQDSVPAADPPPADKQP